MTTAATPANARTVGLTSVSILDAAPSRKAGASPRSNHGVAASPTSAPAPPVIRLSISEARTSRDRDAPRACRTATSWSRAAPRARRSVARFAHAMRMTTATMMAIIVSGWTSCARISRMPRAPGSTKTRKGSGVPDAPREAVTVAPTARSMSPRRPAASAEPFSRPITITHQKRASNVPISPSAV